MPAPANEDEEAATAGLLDLNRVPTSFEARTSFNFSFNGRRISTIEKLNDIASNVMNAPSMEIDEENGSPVSSSTEEITFVDMWAHTHEEICDFVRRIPEVLRDAQFEPRIATAARLIWGRIPPSTPPLPAEQQREEETQKANLKRWDQASLETRPKRVGIKNELD